ncbi:hydrocephalus-inducing protein homolog isoform X4 [Myotis yumanensis]|uniref:hydrocephalus-inducing protein homolog isoform X4 n=1 Tax=Myotis yumanensis TaxID=159337 RepID=UPI0038D4457F
MTSRRLEESMGAVQMGLVRMLKGFQSKVLPPLSPRVVKEEDVNQMLTPSEFLKEMSLTTEQRLSNTRLMCRPQIIELLDMGEATHQKFSDIDLDQALFQPFPSEIIFQNYTPCEVYEVPLVLRNNDKIPRMVKVIEESSPYFKVISPKDIGHKVAPGVPSIFRILFTPEENKDYAHMLTCVTEREKFIVPIKARGARAILDFPDKLNFSTCPVKYRTQKILLVRNIGNRDAVFHITTYRPFSVEPSVGTLTVGESMQLEVDFEPQTVGNHSQRLVVYYDTGEKMFVSLYGAAVDMNIRLDKNSLIIEKTYISLANQRTITIYNRSNIIAHFQWKVFATQEEEDKEKYRVCEDLIKEEKDETDEFQEFVSDPLLRERISILSRTFENQRRLVQADSILFLNNIFIIEPPEGDVWPNSSAEITVYFNPLEARLYQMTVYCDISGREIRLPLRIKGQGMGPKIHFNFELLDIGKVFVGSVHCYEAILSNKGSIDALFNVIPSTSALGACFVFSPKEGIIKPGGVQAVQISFCSSILGHFEEKFLVSVNGSPEPVKLTIRGCVIGPTFHFNVPALHFGDVSFGFPHTLICSLNNTSLVPMTFKLRIPGDGHESISSCEQYTDTKGPSWNKEEIPIMKPKEFTITPNCGTIRSQGFAAVRVTLCSNTVQKYELALVVDVEGIGEEVLALLITARCIVPALRMANAEVDFGRCFLKYPYEKTIQLVNPDDLPGCYEVLPQVDEDSPAVLLSSPNPYGIIPPQSTVHIPLILETQVTGEHRSTIYISVFGSQDHPVVCQLRSIGEGPVISVCPHQVDFGKIFVLKESSRVINLSNQSPIPGLFQAHMAHKKSLWTVEPSEGTVPPEDDIQLTLTANLNDILMFKDTVILDIINSNTYRISVQAEGIGSTIVSDKPFAPELNLGAHFSLDTCYYHFKLTNKGRRVQQLFWMNEKFQPKNKKVVPKRRLAKRPCAQAARRPQSPVFQLQPFRMELYPDQTIDVTLDGYSATPRMVKEKLVCQAIIGAQRERSLVMTVDVMCEFIAPLIQLSTKKLVYRLEKKPQTVLQPDYQPLVMKNISTLPVNVLLSTSKPFFICDMEQSLLPLTPEPIKLEIGEEKNLLVKFDPTHKCDLNNWVAEETLAIRYLEHPQVDRLSLRGEVHYPNLSFETMDLDFGCILNDTEVIRYVPITNCSPLAVKFCWFFLVNEENQIRSTLVDEDTGSEEGEHRRAEAPELLNSDVFDILPLYGELQPYSSDQIAFTFYGHCDITAQATALCKVEGGPNYEITLRGETSVVSYSFDTKDINYGLQLFDRVTETKVTLKNTGKVGFEFRVLTDDQSSPDNLMPGVPLILPLSGFISSLKEQELKIYYLPGVPEIFQRSFQVQIAHLDPESITLSGEGIFPRIYIDLPRNLKGNEKYEIFLNQARENLENELDKDETLSHSETTEEMSEDEPFKLSAQLQMEVERLIVQNYTMEHQKTIIHDPMDEVSHRSRHRLAKIQLPEYILDFGHMILGDSRSHIIKITNTSHMPVSFHAEKRILHDTGFSTELDRVKHLPYCETETFEVRFDQQGTNQSVGNKEIILPIKVVGGPTVHICLQAQVTIPTMTLSCEKVEFATIQCGQCLVETIQLSNHLQVPCEWFVVSHKPFNKLEKHMPKYLRRKLHTEFKPKTRIFEIQPTTGVLDPGEKANVQVRFMPKEEKFYSQTLTFQLVRSTQKLTLLAQGQGLEPRLEFSPSILELGPLLPYAPGDEAEVVVKNPCDFPIEFYSLEFDQQYLIEEKILRSLKGYDSYNTLLLPPRVPGEKLPPEVYEYFKEMKQSKEEQMKAKYLEALAQDNEDEDIPLSEQVTVSNVKRGSLSRGISVTSDLEDWEESKNNPDDEEDDDSLEKLVFQTEKLQSTDSHSAEDDGEVENNPVNKAIARYLGIDVSAEGNLAKNRKGIAIIVHGTPVSGKTATAASLAKYYGAACFNIDSIVLEAICDGNSIPGIRARELCIRAAIEQSMREGEESAQETTSSQLGIGQIRQSSENLGKLTSETTLINPEVKSAKSMRGSMLFSKNRGEHGSGSQKQHHQHPPETPQISSSPLPSGPTPRRLSVSTSIGGETGLLSCVLPEEMLVQMLAERLQLSDCSLGVVFDSLDTLFARNAAIALLCLLKAIGNREHIYVLNMPQDYTGMKAQEKAKKEQEEQKQREALEKEKERLQNMDEEEYDALTEEEKIAFNREVQQALRERKKRELERLARELHEKKLQQELERQKEEDEQKKKMRKTKQLAPKEEPALKKSQPSRQEEPNTSSKGNKQKPKEKTAEQVRDTLKDKRRIAFNRKGLSGAISGTVSPLSDMDQNNLSGQHSQDKFIRLNHFRWIVPANGEVSLRIQFSATDLGNYDQTFNFEILGTCRQYQLYCRGVCAYPYICQDPKVVFPQRKMDMKADEIIFKKYIISTDTFYFGPLLCGKSRDKYRSSLFPGNMETLTILNNSPMVTEVFFCFQNDVKANTYFLEPLNMILKPNEKQILTVWAYPTAVGIFEDSIVCCIKENPEPAIFKLSCEGVRPELDVEPRQLHFDRLLLHRKESKVVLFHNVTALPVAWRITSLEHLGEDFSVSMLQGTIPPKADYSLQVHFQPSKPVNIKKAFRLEVLDPDNLVGVVQIENIMIIAESYDMALDITFPKGAEGGLDFGTVRVLEEVKQPLQLKNRGKYEIMFSFSVDSVGITSTNINSMISVQPRKGSMSTTDKPTNVQVFFRAKKEVKIEQQPILRCQIIEPNMADGTEIIASIPIRLSVNAVFSKYNISPSSIINFGALICGTRKSTTFTIENQGVTDFKYNLYRMTGDSSIPQKKAVSHTRTLRSRESENFYKATPSRAAKFSETVQREINIASQARYNHGMFSVYPGFGSISAGGIQTITVDCMADPVGKCEEFMAIDISDRDPRDHPGGIPYSLLAEACLPAFVTDNNASIFEEHQICNSTNLYSILQTTESKGLFVEDENKFMFSHVMVGHQAKARFKMSNVGKIPCDVTIVVKPVSNKATSRIIDIFEVEPNKMCIASRSHAFATVTFTPQTMQSYQCIFEATLDGMPSIQTKNRSLTFDIVGEGTLPRVTIVRPILHNQYGNLLLLFKRLLLGHSEKLPLILKNNGNIPAQLHVDLQDQLEVFSLKGRPTTSYIYIIEENKAHAKAKKAHTASLVVLPGETAEFDVVFQARNVGRMTGTIHLSVRNNQYEDTIIRLVGEGYEDDITLDNVHGLVAPTSREAFDMSEVTEDVSMENLVAAALVDHIQFGDCHLGSSYSVSFTVTNHSQVNVIRFEWPSLATITFAPQTGHLHPGCAKDIVMTLKSDIPINMRNMDIKCKVSKIMFQQPADQVPDWDDRMRTVKWVDMPRNMPGTFTTKRKVIETDPEPAHSVLEEHYRELMLQISANVNFASYQCQTSDVHFKDTLVYQTRVFQLELVNTGSVQLEFSWILEETAKTVSFAMPENQGSQKDQLSQGSTADSAVGHWTEPSPLSFSVDPVSGVVPVGKAEKIQVKFSPLEVGDFESTITCQIPNLLPGEQGPVISAKGQSFLPICHFELKESDYITAHRHNPDLRGPGGGPLDPNTRVIEFTSVGIGGKNLRTFTILNPTASIYCFRWVSEEMESLQNPSAFTCLTEKGCIHPEKKAEIIFQFTPLHLKTTEAFWTFSVPEHNITVPFLLVGKASDPLVNLDKSHINFSCLLIGREVRETVQIINREEQGFSFAFQDNSRYSEGFNESLVVSPMEGWLPPMSRLQIDILFTPKQEGDVNFNLICNVKRKAHPLTLNVKAEGYTMNAEVKCKDRTGLLTLLTPSQTTIVNFYEVELNECVQCEFTFINAGKFNFSFQAELSGPKALVQYFEFSPMEGSVDVGQSTPASLSFQPFKKCVLKGLELRIKISHGPTFTCSISGSAVNPAVHFSFTSHNFGTCFIYQAGMPPYKQTLVITNKEETAMSIDCLYTNTTYLEVSFRADVIKPGKSMEIPITFYPRESISYRELIPFEINGLSQQVVEIKGKGTEMKILVLDPANRILKLGAAQPGQVVKKTVSIMNNSQAPVTFSQSVLFSTPELREPKVITLVPFNNITLKPKEVRKLEIIFAPKKRVPPFSEEVFMESMGLLRPLFLLSGCCQALEVSLDQQHIPFGPVVHQTKATRRILMLNTGDVGTRFKWDVKKFEPNFSISPEEGYITTGMEVSLEVTYHPTEVGKENLYKNLLCFIQGGPPLSLTLSGVCVGLPAVKETVNFTCQVRSKHTQTIQLSNRTNQTWNLHPIFEGECWEGPEFITLEPHQQNKPYEITYKPRTMNVENRKHQGTLFFPLPDGTGWLYALHGTAEPPKAVANIYREVPCKTPYTELLTITNWLNKPQRFRVIVEMLKPEKPDLSASLKGLDYIDVLSGSKKDYKLNFFSHKEGLYSAKVIFRNEVTNEFLYYVTSFRVIPSGVMKTIEMSSPVRQSTSASVKVENPLPYSVTFATECRVPDINLPSQFVVPPNSEGTFSFEFQPLRAGETLGRLVLHNNDLGYYQYELNLKALPALPEKPIHFQTVLGSGQSILAKFINYTRQKTEYYCRSDCVDFHTEKVISAAAGAQGGTEISVEVYFEPSHLGDTKGTLSLSSVAGGEYIIPLFGVAMPPKPQGPLQIRAGSNIVIPFKNVFYHTVTYSFIVEHPAFSVRAIDSVRPKKTNNITVYFDGNPSGSKTPITSKLIVSCPPGEGRETGVKWVYYLKGITP